MCARCVFTVGQRDVQRRRDLAVRVTVGEQHEHFALACGERARLGRARRPVRCRPRGCPDRRRARRRARVAPRRTSSAASIDRGHQPVDVQAQELGDRVGRDPAEQQDDRAAAPAARAAGGRARRRACPAGCRSPRAPRGAGSTSSTTSAASRRLGRDLEARRRAASPQCRRAASGCRPRRRRSGAPGASRGWYVLPSGPPGTRTLNQRVKSPVLYLLS